MFACAPKIGVRVHVQHKQQYVAEAPELYPAAIIAKTDASAAEYIAAGSAPKTGVASDGAMYLGVAVMLPGAAGMAVRRAEHNRNLRDCPKA